MWFCYSKSRKQWNIYLLNYGGRQFSILIIVGVFLLKSKRFKVKKNIRLLLCLEQTGIRSHLGALQVGHLSNPLISWKDSCLFSSKCCRASAYLTPIQAFQYLPFVLFYFLYLYVFIKKIICHPF